MPPNDGRPRSKGKKRLYEGIPSISEDLLGPIHKEKTTPEQERRASIQIAKIKEMIRARDDRSLTDPEQMAVTRIDLLVQALRHGRHR